MRKSAITLGIILAITMTGCTRQVKKTATEEYREIPPYVTFIPCTNGKTTTIIPIYHSGYKERKYLITYSDGTTKEKWIRCE